MKDRPPFFDPKTSLFIEDHPHIHIHTLTSGSKSEKEDEQSVAEICCHPCGESIYVIFNNNVVKKYNGIHPELVKLKTSFIERHEDCAEEPVIIEGYEIDKFEFTLLCPTKRNKTTTIDITNT